MTATLIPFPPRLVDLQPFSERECSDFLSPDRHDLLPVTVLPGEASSPSPLATYSNRRALNCHLAVMQAGEDGPQPETSPAHYSPWTVSREHWWRA